MSLSKNITNKWWLTGSCLFLVSLLAAGCTKQSPARRPSAIASSTKQKVSDYAVADGTTFQWRTMKVGAGGYIGSLNMSNDGSTKVIRTDTYGAYVWDNSSVEWKQLVTTESMPAMDIGLEKNAPVSEVVVAPSMPSRLYMHYRGFVYRSDNKGLTFSKTAFAAKFYDFSARFTGETMAVDSVNPDILYVGTQKDGLFVTFNGGINFQQVTSIPLPLTRYDGAAHGVSGLAFDPSGGATNGRTNVIYAASQGQGLYRSRDAGATWAKLGAITGIHHGESAHGSYYGIELRQSGGNKVYRITGDMIQDITPFTNWDFVNVTVNPANSRHIVTQNGGGTLVQSFDNGATWSNPWIPVTRTAIDVPWLAWTEESYMSAAELRFDPVEPNKLIFTQGIGVFTTAVSQGQALVNWFSQSAGIEQLVGINVMAPPGGKPILGAMDRPLFRIEDPEVYPSQHGPNRENAIQMGWAVDYSHVDPNYIVSLVNYWGKDVSSLSRDGGRTWQKFGTHPFFMSDNNLGGGIAVSAPGNIVVSTSNSVPYFTKDHGLTWQASQFPSVVTNTADGWGWKHWFNRKIVTADRVNTGTFFIYNYNHGLFKSTDGGATFQLVRSGQISEWSTYHAMLKAVPGQANELFFTSGNQSGPEAAPMQLMRSRDGGATWSGVTGTQEVTTFGFGKSAVAGGYPSIYIVGHYNGVYGVFMSSDNAQSFKQIGAYPISSLDGIVSIDGDKDVYGKVYVAFGGSGFAYGFFASATAPAPAPAPAPEPAPAPAPEPAPAPAPEPAPAPAPEPAPAPAPDATAPDVVITAPTGTTVTRGATVTLQASASDNIGVARVEFYVNDALKCPADTVAPYSCAWKVANAPGKVYRVRARA